LGDRGVIALAKGITDGCALESINLAKNEISERGMEHLSEVMPKIHLTHLDISCNPIGTKGAKFLYNSISRKKSPLKILNISSCSIESRGFYHIFSAERI